MLVFLKVALGVGVLVFVKVALGVGRLNQATVTLGFLWRVILKNASVAYLAFRQLVFD